MFEILPSSEFFNLARSEIEILKTSRWRGPASVAAPRGRKRPRGAAGINIMSILLEISNYHIGTY